MCKNPTTNWEIDQYLARCTVMGWTTLWWGLYNKDVDNIRIIVDAGSCCIEAYNAAIAPRKKSYIVCPPFLGDLRSRTPGISISSKNGISIDQNGFVLVLSIGSIPRSGIGIGFDQKQANNASTSENFADCYWEKRQIRAMNLVTERLLYRRLP